MTDIRNDGTQQRYEAFVDDRPAGFCQYELQGDTVTFTHTVVQPAFEGAGVGSALARFALEDCRAHGKTVVAQCSFIAGYIRRHGEFADLLA
ncbi:MAG: N-acetyltransferase [Polaromonas sp.]|nr:N-acetyltransferase [Polaromonas sp.]